LVEAGGRDLMPLVFGTGVKAEAADHIEPGPRDVLGRRLAAPTIEAVEVDVLIAKGPGILRE
jgi:hypothetical protein